MHVHMHMWCVAAQACVFNDIKNHTHACNMHIRVSFRMMMTDGAMANYSNAMGADMYVRTYVCRMVGV